MKTQTIPRSLFLFLVVAGVSKLTLADAPPGRYTISNNGTVYDNVTKLTWQQTIPSNSNQNGLTWDLAQTACSSLSLGGFSSGWRVPTVKELYSIVDVEKNQAPLIDTTAFPNASTDAFWTSTPSSRVSDAAWFIDFELGRLTADSVTGIAAVRCVRSGGR